jgi:hypothetical protein
MAAKKTTRFAATLALPREIVLLFAGYLRVIRTSPGIRPLT